MAECGIPGFLLSSQYCDGKTSTPFCITIPLPGPLKYKCHFGSFTWLVILWGNDQLRPSSSLLTSTNWPVVSGERPGSEPLMERFPLLHNAVTHNFFVTGSNRTAGSPTPLFSCGAPISMIIFIGSQL